MAVRIYGKNLNYWKVEDERGREIIRQIEIAYREYETTGELVGAGSEDFSPERESREIEDRWVWTWDGQRLNKGGKRWFKCAGLIRFRKSEKAAVKAYLQTKYNAAVLQLR